MIQVGIGRPAHVVLTTGTGHPMCYYWYNPEQALELAARIEQAAQQAMHGKVPPCYGEYGRED